MRSAARLVAVVAIFTAGGWQAVRAAQLAEQPSPSASFADLEQAKYDQTKLKKLLESCTKGLCPQGLEAATESRLDTIAKEQKQFTDAETEADYRAYLSACVACAYREDAEQLIKNLKPATAAATPPAPAATAATTPAGPPSLLGDQPSGQAQSAQPSDHQSWHAVARVMYRVRGRPFAVVAYSGPQSSPLEATRAAKNKCERISDGNECDVGQAGNNGCLFIAVGHRRGSVVTVAGTDKQETYDRCRNWKGGYSCDVPSGGCLN